MCSLQYPTSFCYIFKELIQNAEDAGATEVKFMFDETEYGLESLWSPEMAQYQGTLLFICKLTGYTLVILVLYVQKWFILILRFCLTVV